MEEGGGCPWYTCARISAGSQPYHVLFSVAVSGRGGVLEQEPDAEEYFLHTEEGSWGMSGQENVAPPELEDHVAPGPHRWQDVSLAAFQPSGAWWRHVLAVCQHS